MITALHHVQLAMPPGREDDARRFYVDVLGFEELPKPDELRERGGAWFRSGGADVHLGVEPDFRAAKKAHPAFLLKDLTAVVTRCNQAGFSSTPDDLLPGYKRAYVHDPFGNRIELMEEL